MDLQIDKFNVIGNIFRGHQITPIPCQSSYPHSFVCCTSLMTLWLQELNGLPDDPSLPDEERSSPTQALTKLTALIRSVSQCMICHVGDGWMKVMMLLSLFLDGRVFTTVVTALGNNFSPSRCPEISPNFVKDVRVQLDWSHYAYVYVYCACRQILGHGVETHNNPFIIA